VASYYGGSFEGRRTASGSRYNPWQLTAGSPWLPLGSKVRVTASNGRSVEVEVTDRMAAPRRVIDLSYQAAQTLAMIRQ
jgi:peptidoglycan lytic transglycosylase